MGFSLSLFLLLTAIDDGAAPLIDLVGFNDVETTLPGAGPPLPLEPASSSTLALLCEEDLNASSWVTHFPVLPDYFNNN